ncbi:T9SS type A sorting domain-containing protein [Carboxylicivirga sp. M1479]|uniref:T9SS type A sorting domain-containing protein n=1 Tax=Carboxylicivirga sp. M1479 TaxID=2594476 RepID=UPI001177E28E|nr:T9SS type A sorting domain-containing protein [Carboxylicivirga sp. M1479]TRX71783.1 T9SS type A sorting domain-containing protein [Carboxylicivirga sp. M1479]
MLKNVKLFLLLLLTYQIDAQNTCSENELVAISGNVAPISSYSLGMSSGVGGTMLYCPSDYNHDNGGHYYLQYVDLGGTGMDGYPNIRIGGSQYGGQWHPGDYNITGMPVQIKDIPEAMEIEWVCSQANATDSDDKWMASINFIFDMYGDETSKPVSVERDYDLVIKAQSFNFNDNLEDQPEVKNGILYFFARNADHSLKPFEISINGRVYTYAVRYKFFDGQGDKDDKAHIKLIPYGDNGAPPALRMKVKELIATTKEFVQYANIPEPYLSLALNNIAQDDTWMKAINAGYEVYTGQSQLNITKYKLWTDGLPTSIAKYEMVKQGIGPNPARDIVYIFDNDVPCTVQCFSIRGQEQSIQLVNNSFRVAHIKNGFYIIRVVNCKGETSHYKLMVDK